MYIKISRFIKRINIITVLFKVNMYLNLCVPIIKH